MNNTTISRTCLSCGSHNVSEVLTIDNVPAHCCLLWDDRQRAINCPKGDIQLNFCQDCGHLYNQFFDEDLMSYSQEYDNTLDFSKVFQEYSRDLVQRLTISYNLYKKEIIEIGCGKGDFLRLICQEGSNQGYGFDKSYDPRIEEKEGLNSVKFIQDFYSRKYEDYNADLILSRHVLEHISTPFEFVREIRDIRENRRETVFYFEVPNILYTLRDGGIWDLIYEHCSYFNGLSIFNLFKKLNFKILDVRETYNGQFLSIECILSDKDQKEVSSNLELNEIQKLVTRFEKFFIDKTSFWKQKLRELHSDKKRIIVWGGGSKGVSFLNFLKTQDIIQEIVDINPRKTGKYIAGTGQRYVVPEELIDLKPDVIIIMNPLYKSEIENRVREMGLSSEILLA